MKRNPPAFLISIFFTSIAEFWMQIVVLGSQSQYFPGYSQVPSSLNQDIAFGALLPLHFKDKNGGCGSPKHQQGFLWLHALQYAVEEVNRKWNRRSLNASLTLNVRDTCNDEQIALEQALDLANRYRKKVDIDDASDDLKPVLGVISSSQNKDASTLLGLFKVPQIIFGNERNAPENPNEILQSVSVGFYKARALADLIKYFTWSAVSVVYSAANQDDFEIFLRISSIEKLCVAVTVMLSAEETNSARFERTMVKLMSEPASTVVILFTNDEETKELLQSKYVGRIHNFLRNV